MALQRIGGTRSSRLEGSGAATEPAGQVVRVGLAGMESTDYFKLVPAEVVCDGQTTSAGSMCFLSSR